MVDIPGIRASDLILVTWWRNRRLLWRGAAEGREGSGGIVSSSGYLVPVMISKSDFSTSGSSRHRVTNPRSNEALELRFELMEKFLINLARRSKTNVWD